MEITHQTITDGIINGMCKKYRRKTPQQSVRCRKSFHPGISNDRQNFFWFFIHLHFISDKNFIKVFSTLSSAFWQQRKTVLHWSLSQRDWKRIVTNKTEEFIDCWKIEVGCAKWVKIVRSWRSILAKRFLRKSRLVDCKCCENFIKVLLQLEELLSNGKIFQPGFNEWKL